LGTNEKVEIIGSDDGWRTTRTLEALRQPGASAAGVETWMASTDEPLPKEFAVTYAAGGNVYWDHDSGPFGHNYAMAAEGQMAARIDQSPAD
jgi:hypothetical protein